MFIAATNFFRCVPARKTVRVVTATARGNTTTLHVSLTAPQRINLRSQSSRCWRVLVLHAQVWSHAYFIRRPRNDDWSALSWLSWRLTSADRWVHVGKCVLMHSRMSCNNYIHLKSIAKEVHLCLVSVFSGWNVMVANRRLSALRSLCRSCAYSLSFLRGWGRWIDNMQPWLRVESLSDSWVHVKQLPIPPVGGTAYFVNAKLRHQCSSH